MLNEIYKGMDNASEKIDENFDKIGFELVKFAGGFYKKFTNGLLEIYFHELELSYETAFFLSHDVEFPIDFINTNYSVGITQSTRGPVSTRGSVNISYSNRAVGSITIRLNGGGDFSAGDITDADLEITGFWK